MGVTLYLAAAGLAVAVMAFIAAIPPVLQWWFGAPNITIAFVSGGEMRFDSKEHYERLACHLQNQPIRRGPLRWLRVRRTSAENIRVHCAINSADGYQLVYSPSGRIFEGGTDRWAVLPSSDVPVWLGIVEANGQDGLVRPFGTSLGRPEEPPMPAGTYTFSVTVTAERLTSKADARFRVTTERPFLEWL